MLLVKTGKFRRKSFAILFNIDNIVTSPTTCVEDADTNQTLTRFHIIKVHLKIKDKIC